jgi:hypothetical protein
MYLNIIKKCSFLEFLKTQKNTSKKYHFGDLGAYIDVPLKLKK